jgi:hypothetical protein
VQIEALDFSGHRSDREVLQFIEGPGRDLDEFPAAHLDVVGMVHREFQLLELVGLSHSPLPATSILSGQGADQTHCSAGC